MSLRVVALLQQASQISGTIRYDSGDTSHRSNVSASPYHLAGVCVLLPLRSDDVRGTILQRCTRSKLSFALPVDTLSTGDAL
ncbi:hypothetical protein AVEN_203780-1 [Araneus ventricosus]|uniref:Uncharacterized protein n=1 Tax=Araneus ventricosus TaxID=182803 RepID=A0A4Y2IQJ1_ARAVE|nr:hypothetical protein AVEN_203780-1 [Araneus ventricosus]